MFAKRLKELRLEANLTQKEIADFFNTSPQSYAQWEKSLRKPTSDTLQKLADFFNVSTDYLLGNTDIKNSDEINLSDFELLYRKTSKNLSEEEKSELEKELKEFLKERQKIIEAKKKNDSL
ncbi:helix-turn-helix transcriptional regulator [Streptococcus canis]|uniref:helix-turn-helix domain-containing protein n=1 Tax=Streptococcus canis TaxID=1329 RepID=UPI0029498A81|nr:helix-turn-helix transcriptional regulator [Streptococcus canis]MDV5987549.1 helix-turn-helix transcriptional regulator [Streptococcus canis]